MQNLGHHLRPTEYTFATCQKPQVIGINIKVCQGLVYEPVPSLVKWEAVLPIWTPRKVVMKSRWDNIMRVNMIWSCKLQHKRQELKCLPTWKTGHGNDVLQNASSLMVITEMGCAFLIFAHDTLMIFSRLWPFKDEGLHQPTSWYLCGKRHPW